MVCTAIRQHGSRQNVPCDHQWILEEEGPCCPTCRAHSYQPVPPSPADKPALYANLALDLANLAALEGDTPAVRQVLAAFSVLNAAHLRTVPIAPVEWRSTV